MVCPDRRERAKGLHEIAQRAEPDHQDAPHASNSR
jgi:hypothetical protein